MVKNWPGLFFRKRLRRSNDRCTRGSWAGLSTLAVLLVVPLAANRSRGELPTAGVVPVDLRTEADVPFQQVAGETVTADLYRPAGEKILPVIIMIHGGAWIAGDKWNVVGHALEAAREGFVVMAINYRLAPKHAWPAQLEDCRAALGWIEKNAEAWKIDLQRVGVWGYSAGGHLALLMTLDPAKKLPPIQACVAGGPPCDLDWIPPQSRMLEGVFGGTRQELPERYRAASPISYLNRDDPPLFLFHGTRDAIVPIENARKFHAQATKLGIQAELHEVDQLGHLMTFLDPAIRMRALEFLKQNLQPDHAR